MRHQHSFSGQNDIHIYRRQYRGDGTYYQRGICKGLQVGDEIESMRYVLVVTEILSVNDSKGKFTNKDDGENVLYEAVLTDPSFSKTNTYIPVNNI